VFATLAAVSLIGLALVLILHDAGVDHERHEAEAVTEAAGRAVVAPLVTPQFLRGSRTAAAALDRAVRRYVLAGPVERVKVWSRDGRILYSDEPRLVGRRFELQEDELEVLENGGVVSELSDLAKPENRFEPRDTRLLEVYTRITGVDGTPVLFEVYHDFDSIVEDGRSLVLVVLPALALGLFALAAANVAVARWFTRYARRRDEQRTSLLAKALDASNAERRRISADLHDGVVQDLTGAALAIDGVVGPLRSAPVDPGALAALQAADETIRRSIRTLRTLLMDFYPASLEARGLAAALEELAQLSRERGLATEVQVTPGLELPAPVEALLYRIAQEAVRNATTHAQARNVAIAVGADSDSCWVEVKDDGEGFDTGAPPSAGHFGLRAARDLVSDAGGTLSIRSNPGSGSVVRAELPVSGR
jgi:signal transduction histidine kinase